MQQQPTIILQGVTVDELISKFREATAQAATSAAKDEVMDVSETAALCRCSVSTIRRQRYENTIPYSKINGRIVFLRSKVISWLANSAIEVR